LILRTGPDVFVKYELIDRCSTRPFYFQKHDTHNLPICNIPSSPQHPEERTLRGCQLTSQVSQASCLGFSNFLSLCFLLVFYFPLFDFLGSCFPFIDFAVRKGGKVLLTENKSQFS